MFLHNILANQVGCCVGVAEIYFTVLFHVLMVDQDVVLLIMVTYVINAAKFINEEKRV